MRENCKYTKIPKIIHVNVPHFFHVVEIARKMKPSFLLKGSVRYFWCWTYVKWGYLKFHPLKGFFDTIIRSACRSRNGVLPLTRSPWEPFFPLFFPLIAIPYELEIFPLSILNGAISNFTSSKDFFLRSSVRPVGPKTK